jgi:hypothetical protein
MADTTVMLIKPSTRRQDANGVWHTVEESQREVFARVESVERSEFFAAGQKGLRPELRVTLAAIEYEGEQVCAVDGVRYAIYRTYRASPEAHFRTARNAADPDDLELYLQREVGVHAPQNAG